MFDFLFSKTLLVMKTNIILLAFLFSGLFACDPSSLDLIKNGSTSFEIVIPENADSLEIKSAHALQKYLEIKSGVHMPISSENKSSSYEKSRSRCSRESGNRIELAQQPRGLAVSHPG